MRAFLFAIAVAACATTPTMSTPTGGPRGLRASEHLDAAAQHEAIASHDGMWPDATGGNNNGRELSPVSVPWVRSWNDAADHARLAEIHRGQAAELQAEYEHACGDRPMSEVTVSPLIRFGVGGWMTQTGAIVYLSPQAGAPEALLAALSCHRAWMMLAPSDMDDCPLDLPGLVLDARGDADGVTVSLGVTDAKLVPELQRRVSVGLEAVPHSMHAAAGSAR